MAGRIFIVHLISAYTIQLPRVFPLLHICLHYRLAEVSQTWPHKGCPVNIDILYTLTACITW